MVLKMCYMKAGICAFIPWYHNHSFLQLHTSLLISSSSQLVKCPDHNPIACRPHSFLMLSRPEWFVGFRKFVLHDSTFVIELAGLAWSTWNCVERKIPNDLFTKIFRQIKFFFTAYNRIWSILAVAAQNSPIGPIHEEISSKWCFHVWPAVGHCGLFTQKLTQLFYRRYRCSL